MTFSIQQAYLTDQLNACHELLVTVFHEELHLYGMKIPDVYDPFSVHTQIINNGSIIGTYRTVLPNPSVGLPIEEVGFDLDKLAPGKICEMSRLVISKEQRGKIPFSKIIHSACEVAAQNDASCLIAALLPRNVTLFKRNGFSQIGEPLIDPSVESGGEGESIIVPMKISV